MKRFYQWSPLTYRIAVEKGRLMRRVQDRFSDAVFPACDQMRNFRCSGISTSR